MIGLTNKRRRARTQIGSVSAAPSGPVGKERRLTESAADNRAKNTKGSRDSRKGKQGWKQKTIDLTNKRSRARTQRAIQIDMKSSEVANKRR